MALAASGKELTLVSGGYLARVVSVGAGLAGLTLNGVDLVLPHDADEIPKGYMGKTLVPWPNRIAGGHYTWRGQEYQLPINEVERGHAIHGLRCWTQWRVVHQDKDSATLGTFVAPRPGYPWALECWVTYALHRNTGLSVTITTKNVGTQTAPFGVSHHPYLTVGRTPVDEYTLTNPASRVAEVDERLIPTAIRDTGDLGLDFDEGRLVGPVQLDHAFTGLPEGSWAVHVERADGSWVELESDAPWVQLYSADELGRDSIAVEPMTCAPDAFNSGDGLIELEPGASHTLSFTIRGHIA